MMKYELKVAIRKAVTFDDDFIAERDGKYVHGKWDEMGKAEREGWRYVGSVDYLSEELDEEEYKPEITVKREWSGESVRMACIRNSLYTEGNNEEYSRLLDEVNDMAEEPTKENLYRVAKDICDHSHLQTVTNVMFILEREAVTTYFSIDGRDDV